MQTTIAAAETETRRQRPGWVLAMVLGTTSLTGIGMSIMVVTFPAIRAEFPNATAAQLSWINNLFTIVSAATLIPCGALADRVGRKRMLLIGSLLFTLGSVVGALAPSPGWIMVGRTIQALGAAAFGPASTALLIGAFAPERLPTAIGIWAVASGVTSAAGPSLGGLVIEHGGWPWAFWINLPIGLFTLILGPFVLRETVQDRSRRLPDPVGVALLMAATSMITLAIVQRKSAAGWGWLGSKTLLCIAIGLGVMAWFIVRCRRHPNPLLRLDLFRSDNVRFGVLGLAVSGVAFYSIQWAFVQHTVNTWGWSISRAGAATAPIALLSGISAIASSRASQRYGQRRFIFAGSLGVALSCIYLWHFMGDTPSLTAALVGGGLLGVFSGFVFPAYIATTLLGVPADQHSVGSSVNFMVQRTGATIGTALAITFVAGATGKGALALHQAIAVCAIGSTLGFAIGFLVHRR